VEKPISGDDPARRSDCGSTRPEPFGLLILLGIVAYCALFYGIVAAFHKITDVGYWTIAGRILGGTCVFACALAAVAVLLWGICALERKPTGQPQELSKAPVAE
jgi:hypothetical protein